MKLIGGMVPPGRYAVAALACASILTFGAATAPAAENVQFVKDVWPILRERCISCHGEKKKKGGFALHNPDVVATAIEEDAILIAGKPGESPLFQRVSLPADDGDIMPPEGETLAATEIETIRQWIVQGARIDRSKWHDDTHTPTEVTWPVVSPADPGALRRLRAAGAVIVTLARDSNLLDVSFPDVAGKVGDAQLKLLAGLSQQIARMNLSGTKITDAGLEHLRGMHHLRRLRLSNTEIGDAGVEVLLALPDLRSLAVVGTKVTGKGLAALEKKAGLHAIYAWSTPAKTD